MMLARLDVRGVRNLETLSLNKLASFNLVSGANGSGKTSLLEAVHLLGLGRSFRTSNIRSVINHASEQCTVYGEVEDPKGGIRRLGLSRDKTGGVEIKLDREIQKTRSVLAESLPLQVVYSESFNLIGGSPIVRRQFMDWGVFHVEHSYTATWQRFQRGLKQRNHLLRHGRIDQLSSWDSELAGVGAQIHSARERYIDRLAPVLLGVLQRMAPDTEAPRLVYRRGWDVECSLEEALHQSRESDLRQGFTQSGPQRADLKFLYQGKQAAEVLSRGQQKLLLMGLKLSQASMLARDMARSCLFLIDDLPSEFDAVRQGAVLRELAAMNAQVFVTSIQSGDIAWDSVEDPEITTAMFHVEHGRITRADS